MSYKTLKNSEEYLSVEPIPQPVQDALEGLDYLIYGGFVRDLIAKKHNANFQSGFGDLDIILLWDSHRKLIDRLRKVGYEIGSDQHAEKVYRHWGAVSHVYTMLPKASGLRIQLAAPMPFKKANTPENLRAALLEPVQAVDLVCCGVAITPKGKVIEVAPGAVNDCIDMILRESNLAAHKANIDERIQKLASRGWKTINPKGPISLTWE